MNKTELFINNPVIRSFVPAFGFTLSSRIIDTLIIPLLISSSRLRKLEKQVGTVMREVMPEMPRENIAGMSAGFIRHYRRKIADDCLALNLDFTMTLKMCRLWLNVDGKEHLEKALAADRGVLFAGSHIGSVTYGTICLLYILREMYGSLNRPVFVCTESEVERFPNTLNRLRKASRHYSKNISLLLTSDIARTHGRNIINALEAHGHVTMNMDVMRGGRNRNVYRLYGQIPAYFPEIAGAVKAAGLTGACIVPWRNHREAGRKITLSFEEPLSVGKGELSDQKGNDRFAAYCDTLFNHFQGWLDSSPEQWIYWDRVRYRIVQKAKM